MGFQIQIAIDDLGEGFPSLRLWSELRPEFIKIDMHFVQGVDTDPIELQFLKSIQLIAESCGTHVIAEGIETDAELSTIRDFGILLGQGYFIARPAPIPPLLASKETSSILNARKIAPSPRKFSSQGKVVAQKLLRHIEPAHPNTENEQILERFSANSNHITAEQFFSHYEVSAAATAAKKMAKRTLGNSLFIEQRNPPSPNPNLKRGSIIPQCT